MADDNTDDLGSIAAEHEKPGELRRSVSPTTHDTWRNTLAPILKPVACWRIHHAYFRFDSSVVLPEIGGELPKLKPLINSDRVATIFGHADPVGSVDYNAHLSARRARALFVLLTRNIDIWLELFNPKDYDKWGLASTQVMLAALTRQDGNGNYYQDVVDGRFGDSTDKAIRQFQRDNDLKPDGVAGPDTRRRLYETYIDFLTGTPGEPMIGADQFLGDSADNADPKGKAKAALQGCSEYNPILLFSNADEKKLAKQQDTTSRNARNAPNRRVMVFFFSKARLGGNTPTGIVDVWPCPAWDEGPAKCKNQLWPDHEKRLANGDKERRYEDGEHTMACKWYDPLARLSPCEGGSRLKTIRIRPQMDHDYSYSLKVRGQLYEGAKKPGEIIEHSVPLRATSGTLSVVAEEKKTQYRWSLILGTRDSPESVKGMQERLINLGYMDGDATGSMDAETREAVRDFQLDSGLDPTGEYDDPTRDALKQACGEA
jgi:peptidoglycan hydrolase-like protein with peptidoglycan-binding domain